ncbi:TlpA disulfide reductase family protein [Glaciecola sp. SC05]|uniref:TlpA disulfide reductase family protein n=1 Tax=Glaciecola sp. SC05 TaxID=1987355 RepID=UPI003526E437
MRILIFIFTLFTALPSLASAPNFQIDSDTDLADLKGQVVYIDFWASWCKPCRASFPWMNEMHQKFADKGLKIIAINLDEDSQNAKAFLSKLPAEFAIVYDPKGNIAKQYNLVGMPSSYIIDKSGELRISHQGFFTTKVAAYQNEITQLLAE